jgi:2-succinyl-6-hydroxy-2,4-cyclohexadiene-1-carboxylate synthase
MLRYSIHALHGFLGSPQDWVDFPLPNLHRCDLYANGKPEQKFGLLEWAMHFNLGVLKQKGILMGYSLGGRLALHAVLDAPDLWRAAIIISAHPGLSSDVERQQRKREDEGWAERFLNEPWEDLMKGWNARTVFGGKSHASQRLEHNYDRINLANTLRYWSLSQQNDLLPEIKKLDIPILWVAGELDSRYAAVASRLTLRHPQSKIWIAPASGHRVPWECQTFQKHVETFVEAL